MLALIRANKKATEFKEQKPVPAARSELDILAGLGDGILKDLEVGPS